MTDFDRLAAGAAAVLADAKRDEDSRLEECREIAKFERATLNAQSDYNDRDGTDRHAGKCSHDANGFRIL